MDNKFAGFQSVFFRGKVRLVMVAGCLVVVFIFYMGAVSYHNYKKGLIAAEQDELLMMAETIGKSLVNYIGQELDSLDLYCSAMESALPKENQGQIEEMACRYLEEKKGLYRAAMWIDGNGKEVLLYGEMDFSADMMSKGGRAVIAGKSLMEDGGYQLYLTRKMDLEDSVIYLVFGMDLDKVYQKIVAPVRIGKGGYSVVKDSSLSIIMHHAPGQIGMDAVYDRGERYPDLDLEDLFEWIEMQREQPKGVGMIHSYVWDDPGLPPVERIVAYTTVQLPGEQWIVNSTIPYQEIEAPLGRMLWRLMGICIVFVGAVIAWTVTVTRSLVRARVQKKEIRYLREINEGMELLRHKEEEIQHYQRVQSIGQMSSQIAHEFNNYLTPVIIYAELLEAGGTLGEEDQKLIHGILKSANQAAGLSRKLLDFSRQDTSVVLGQVNLTEDVADALVMIRQLAPLKITVNSYIDGQALWTMGRKDMVKHILMNLCNNAFYAMEEKGGTLTVSLSEAGQKERGIGISVAGFQDILDGGWIVLSVRDTGCGINKETLDKLFEPFYTTKRSGKGTGLGLSVVKNIITAVGGSIRIDTKEGEGTGFYLFFPCIADGGADPFISKGTGHGGAGSTGIHKVLVVDDDPELLKSLQAMLESAGYPFEVFSHPAAVIAKIQNNPHYCSAILTDYSMPSMNGTELCGLVRKLNPQIRLVLMSGTEEPDFEWYLKNRFIDAFILKSDLAKDGAGVLEQPPGGVVGRAKI
ncbi:MAG: response regulator [Lachnospiraceae bacterium]|nr:response regulator [Lachnospiraceae bacterium]